MSEAEELRKLFEPKKENRQQGLSLDEIDSIVRQICNYDDKTAKNLLLLLGEIEEALQHSTIRATAAVSIISRAVFMHTEAGEAAQREFIENLQSGAAC